MDEEAVFQRAIEIVSPHDRAEFLERSCGDDHTLRQRVEQLLNAHFHPDPFFEAIPTELASITPPDHALETVGAIIGRYEILEQIGDGGMGRVFKARQLYPLRREVALKILKPGYDGREVMARFDAERQALEMMDHPNIAKVLDAGVTENGHPFFVMELVQGLPITDFCDRGQLSFAERLKLFLDVCHAVQHAHEKGVIHRDIKPANVLVNGQSQEAAAKVIDFGVAKAAHGMQESEVSSQEAFMVIGTPTYMSPEQSLRRNEDLDTRSDVYSLGVLLYELLTGVTPFEAKRLRNAGIDGVRRILWDETPAKPSRRVGDLAQNEGLIVARNRKATIRKISRTLKGEIDAIVMRALQADRSRRYESAGAFAADLRRYMANEPVEAMPRSIWYQVRKFTSRHRMFATMAALVAVFLPLFALSLTVAAFVILQRGNEVKKQLLVNQRQQKTLSEREARLFEHEYAIGLRLAGQTYFYGAVDEARSHITPYLQRPPDRAASFETCYLWNLCHAEPKLLSHHKRHVFHLAFSRSGKYFASSSADRSVAIWNTSDLLLNKTLTDFNSDVNFVHFSDDQKLLATAEESGVVRVWDWVNRKVVRRLNGFGNFAIASARFMKDQKKLLVVAINWRTHEAHTSVVSIETGEKEKQLENWRALAIDSQGDRLLAVSRDLELAIFSLPDLEKTEGWRTDLQRVSCGLFSPDGRSVATGTTYGDVRIWSLSDHSDRKLLPGPNSAVRSLNYSPDGQLLAETSDGGVTRLWDVGHARILKIIQRPGRRAWSSVFSADGKTLTVGYGEGQGEIEQYAIPDLRCAWKRLHDGFGDYRGVAVDSTGNWIAVIDGNQKGISVYDITNGSQRAYIQTPDQAAIKSAVFATNETSASLWLGANNGVIRRFDVVRGEFGKEFRPTEHPIAVQAAASSILCTQTEHPNEPLRFWDLNSFQSLGEVSLKGPPGRLNARFFLNDSTVLLAQQMNVVLYDVRAHKQIHHLQPLRWPGGIAASPDQRLLACGTEGLLIHLWDLGQDGKELRVLRGHADIPTTIAFSPDGRTLASAGDLGTIKLWNVSTGQPLFDLTGHAGKVRFLQFAANRRRLVSACEYEFEGKTKHEVFVWGDEDLATLQPAKSEPH
jgi:serine/threonine protein kinase/WD40 repeat protein